MQVWPVDIFTKVGYSRCKLEPVQVSDILLGAGQTGCVVLKCQWLRMI